MGPWWESVGVLFATDAYLRQRENPAVHGAEDVIADRIHQSEEAATLSVDRIMVSVVDAIGLLIIIGINAAIAAVLTRLFRVRLDTRWGSVLYAILLIPVVQLVVVLILSGLAGLGGNLGSAAAVVGITILLPLSVGMAFDYFWQPAPEEVELPDRERQRS